MKPLSTPRLQVDARCRLLSPGWRVTDIAEACRSAALAFAWCAHRAWNRRELARWLIGPYAAAIGSNEQARPRRVPSGPIEEITIQDLLLSAHSEVLADLRHCDNWQNDPTFARDMVNRGLVIGVVDEIDAIGYAPLNVWNMRLVDRVRSLFIADYLTRPTDYASFTICDACSAATFDGADAHRTTCEASAPASGLQSLVLRRRRRVLIDIHEDGFAEQFAAFDPDNDEAPLDLRRRRTLDFGIEAFEEEDLAIDLTDQIDAAMTAA